MLFNSWEFIALLLLTMLFYFNVSEKFKTIVLFISSYVFYIFWRWDFALLMGAVSLINYFAAIRISQVDNQNSKKLWLSGAVILSLLPLIYFKYGNFLIANVNATLSAVGGHSQFNYLKVILPVGISFFTFQALSYALDVYYGRTKVETILLRFSTFVAFFPQLVAGPIERSSNLLQQLKTHQKFNRTSFIEGAKLFIWGLFKKVVIADRLALYVNKVYDSPELYGAPTLILATLFFAFQIYCDFSGYSDMAIATARMMGFKLMQNFNLPYFANSISEFWKRWHISLSTWFGDYLYIPLGGSRVVYLKWIRNIFIVFLVSGLWHGANWTFILWGGLHAMFYLIENWGDKLLKKMNLSSIKNTTWYKLFKIIVVFVGVCYAWIYFRATSINDALLITYKIFNHWDQSLYLGASSITFALSCGLIFMLVLVQLLQYAKICSLYFSKSKVPPLLSLVGYLSLLLGISLLGMSSQSFIYFQF
ncbi:MBOAT family O-acyltransferase [Aquimarina agarivorans]|uniref:MBOAT family O-acyltransferase n=1 Tax=Aquimarina agarivorans TaxID=980584 RepID=UPI000248E852|nr:MBOAT family O-acyltransferase [Aquimarina agarivorans]